MTKPKTNEQVQAQKSCRGCVRLAWQMAWNYYECNKYTDARFNSRCPECITKNNKKLAARP